MTSADELAELKSRVATLEARLAGSEPPATKDRSKRCYFVREGGERILIPMCWGSVNWNGNDLSRCYCR